MSPSPNDYGADNDGNDMDLSGPAVGARMKNDSEVENLEKHLDGKDASEDIVKVGQHKIPEGDDDEYLIMMMMKNFLKAAKMPIL